LLLDADRLGLATTFGDPQHGNHQTDDVLEGFVGTRRPKRVRTGASDAGRLFAGVGSTPVTPTDDEVQRSPAWSSTATLPRSLDALAARGASARSSPTATTTVAASNRRSVSS
jgi:hypothetical protein